MRSAPVGAFSPAMAEADRAIKGFLYPRMYRHARIMRIMGDAERVVCDLFARYADEAGRHAGGMGAGRRAPARTALRRIADFIAGMTDRYALDRARAAVRLDAGAAVGAAARFPSRIAAGTSTQAPRPVAAG